MSKINRIRIMNLNYNRNTVRIDDETFDLGGETTLISLRNGGGKTVLVQMVMSLFMNKSYRDLGDRLFQNYFTTSRPTFLMTEWKLDESDGYFLAGMMVRKNQNSEDTEPLEIITFTGEYSQGCEFDLDNLPVIEYSQDKKVLKSFGSCRREFEQLKKKYGQVFSYYDMSNNYQRKNYFSKLKEYQINHREWETIIKKVNLKESGLSELFANAKDEKGLIEKWMLYAIRNKLNQGSDRVKKFQELAYQLIEQYRRNQSNIRRKEIIDKYFEDVVVLEEQILSYEECDKELEEQKSQIAQFMLEVNQMIQRLGKSLDSCQEKIEDCHQQMRKIQHEKYSYEIHSLEEQKAEYVQDRIASEINIQQSEAEEQRIDKELCLQECAGLYREVMDFSNRLQSLEETKRLLLEEEKGTEEERRTVGGKLSWYYQQEFSKLQEKSEQNHQKQQQCQQEITQWKGESQTAQKQQLEYKSSEGALQNELKAYGRQEDYFNGKYGNLLARNILGEYEEGTLALLEKTIAEDIMENTIRQKKAAESIEKIKQKSDSLSQQQIELEKRKQALQAEETEAQKQREHLQQEKVERLSIMKLVEVEEAELDNTELILAKLNGKIKSLKGDEKAYEDSRREKQQEYDRLKQGTLMELPKDIQQLFSDHDIKVTYGMEWLKRSPLDYQEKQRLVKQNPFIPYSLILSKQDMENLKNIREEVYTSFPIPLIVREKLEVSQKMLGSGVVAMENMAFMVMFNHHLLDPDQLKKLLENLEKQIQELKSKIQMKEQETESYYKKKNLIEVQEFSTGKLQALEGTLEKISQEKEVLDQKSVQIAQERQEYKEKQQQEENAQKEYQKEALKLKNKSEDFRQLKLDYEKYLDSREELERVQRKIKDTLETLENLKKKIEEHEKTQRILYKENAHLENEQKEMGKKTQQYRDYDKVGSEMSWDEEKLLQISGEIPALEARYTALTQGITARLQDIENNIQLEQSRLFNKQSELHHKNKYQIPEEQYKNVTPLEEKIEQLEKNREEAKKRKNKAQEENTALEKNITRLDEGIKHAKIQLEEKTGYKELLEKKQISNIKFEERYKLTEAELQTVQKEKKQLEESRNDFQNTESVLSKYSEFKILEQQQPIDVSAMDRSRLNQYQGELQRTYYELEKKLSAMSRATERIIKQMAEQKEYQEEFFKKCFDNLLALVDNVANLRIQSDITKSSFDTRRKKLEEDLKTIEAERENLEELFLEYVKDIDDNMRMIDKNSSIQVRQRNIKMLRLVVPDWNENVEIYKVRVRDFVDSFLRWGMDTLDRNENLEETLGKLITTEKLYDDVVGTGNIEVKLYKIEAEREVLISWKEVSENSGGEGFLSAFVILSCLLSYMRRDETDLFAKGEEGKVLIMDNPFAQTYSEHLLKPLMEIARKTNTQLICLSGIGGGNIYNRFENIYVLNLVKSGFRQELEYVKAEHLRGEDIKKLELSQFKAEQLSLFEEV